MAVIPTGAIYKALFFDGESSRNYGVYITGEAVYNSPERDVEMIKIPGRNGEFALDNGRFENIEVTYPAGIFTNNETDFAAAISDFRNFLASRVGYCRLEDEYNPNEYRMAVYKSGLNVDPAKLEAGEFSITFDCKPQRWLKDGETAVTIGEWGETETASGDIVTVENPNGILAVKSLEVDLEPIQDLNGYSKPWVGGAGKNLFVKQTSGTRAGATFTVNSDGSIKVDGTVTGYSFIQKTGVLKAGTYILSGSASGKAFPEIQIRNDATDALLARSRRGETTRLTLTEDTNVRFRVLAGSAGEVLSNVTVYPQLELGSSATAYEPYENICPISGHTSVDVIVSPTTTASDGTTYTTALGRTVYGGNLEQISGVLTDKLGYVDLGSLDWTYTAGAGIKFSSTTALPNVKVPATASDAPNAICSAFEVKPYAQVSGNNARLTIVFVGSYAEGQVWCNDSRFTDAQSFKAAMSGVQLVYELATPQTYQLTAQQISLLTGDNNIWSDGDIMLEYGQNPSVLFNPTLFESSPLLETAGSGTIQFNGYSIDFEGVPIGEIVVGEHGASSSSGSTSDNPYTKTITLDTTLLNIGDAIYPEVKDCSIGAIMSMDNTNRRYTALSVASTNNVLDANISWHISKKHMATFRLYPDFGEGFVYGTAKTINCSAAFNYGIDTSSATNTETVQVSIAYDGADTYTVTVTRSGTLATHAIRALTAVVPPTMYGDSSKPNDNPIFIDCDLGEAYTNEGGVYRSLNQYIDLGSELPTLGVGANEVTFDSTITELKITPRWWKV